MVFFIAEKQGIDDMVMGTFGLFALIVGGLGLYLLGHTQGFLGLTADQARGIATWFGWGLTLDAVLLVASLVIYGATPLPAGLFVIVATIMTTILGLVVVQRLFK